jgi:pimeloyl-ACP methyl ester carboxylesterase
VQVRARTYPAAISAALVAFTVSLVGGATGVAAARPPSSEPVCRDVSISTGLSPSAPQNLQIYGELCTPADSTPTTIQVLVHGATYSHTYWNFPGFDGKYSYSGHMNRAGYATLAIDLLGVGRSSHPLSASVTIDSEAYAIHSAVQAARSGTLGTAYRKVILVGHSLGTLTNHIEAATYDDADGYIATGTSHGAGPLGLVDIFETARPALLDPVTAPQVPFGDLGYLSIPGARTDFYAGGDVDPAVLAADEATRSPDPGGYAATLAPYLAATPLLRTDEITAPVLLVNGSNDSVFCRQGGGLGYADCANDATLAESEGPFYGPAAQLETYVLPRSGHDINLVPNAELWYDRALEWCQRVAPPA